MIQLLKGYLFLQLYDSERHILPLGLNTYSFRIHILSPAWVIRVLLLRKHYQDPSSL